MIKSCDHDSKEMGGTEWLDLVGTTSGTTRSNGESMEEWCD